MRGSHFIRSWILTGSGRMKNDDFCCRKILQTVLNSDCQEWSHLLGFAFIRMCHVSLPFSLSVCLSLYRHTHTARQTQVQWTPWLRSKTSPSPCVRACVCGLRVCSVSCGCLWVCGGCKHSTERPHVYLRACWVLVLSVSLCASLVRSNKMIFARIA
eukprot:COSAG02_NODE_3787_length_6232_cov_22.002120_9_plen_157_part_00